MPIISVRNNEDNRWKRNARKGHKRQTKKKTENNKESEGIEAIVRAKLFCCAFKLGFLQFIFKASLLFNVNLELALWIILRQRELCDSRYVVVECRCLKIWYLLSFLIWSSILVLKWWQVSPIWLELQLAQLNLYTR